MIIVGPGYIGKNNLPYASDIFFHGNLLYFLPTGFHPIEIKAVFDFPQYCFDNGIQLPKIMWDFCTYYFNNTKSAITAIELLEPLHNSKNITIKALSYPRDIAAINRSFKIMKKNPIILKTIANMPLDVNLIAREVYSHVLFEIFLEGGYEGSIKYLKKYSTPEEFLNLLSAVLVNRLDFFTKSDGKLILHENHWLDLLNILSEIHQKPVEEKIDDYFRIEHFNYKLFQSLLLPIFGRCDSIEKNKMIAKLYLDRKSEIKNLIDECKSISTEIVLLSTNDKNVKRDKLSELLSSRIIDPFSNILDKPKREVKEFIINFTTDSTIIGGLLSIVHKPDISIVGLSVMAGAAAASISQIINRNSTTTCPSQFLLTSLRKTKVHHKEWMKQIENITIELIP